MRISAKTKKWIALVSMVLLALLNISMLKAMLPAQLLAFKLGTFGVADLAAIATLVGAYWLASKQLD